uniref:Uncharacterized protein n=1 Tax=Cacopsylla melanoneura TaxID=428564 RepID=A0A8D9EAU5_9HEMI
MLNPLILLAFLLVETLNPLILLAFFFGLKIYQDQHIHGRMNLSRSTHHIHGRMNSSRLTHHVHGRMTSLATHTHSLRRYFICCVSHKEAAILLFTGLNRL